MKLNCNSNIKSVISKALILCIVQRKARKIKRRDLF